MPSASIAPVSLNTLLSRQAGAGARRFVADAEDRAAVADMAAGDGGADGTAGLAGKCVVLALARQIDTIRALIQLDGVARRLVLWPQDRPLRQIDGIMQPAGVDAVVTSWPQSGLQAGPQAGSQAAAPAALRQNGMAAGSAATEWVLFTSGTTNQPKMVLHTLESLSGHLWAGAGAAGDTVWSTFYDIRRYGGLQVALRALIGGGGLVLSGGSEESPAAFLARAARDGVTHILGTPSHWRRALMSDAAGLLSPKYVRLSGEVADQVILDRLRETYPAAQIVHAFASTEAGLAFEVADDLAGFPASIVTPSGATPGAPAGDLRVQDGALQYRSARNAAGYLDGGIFPIAGADGFVDTGDMVEQRGDRYYFAGRRDGTVNVGGQKVHPEEVEAVINLHPNVHMSLVRGRANAITGAVVMAQIVPRMMAADASSQRLLEQEVQALCRAHLPPYKVPALVRVVAGLDVAPSGKLVRAGA